MTDSTGSFRQITDVLANSLQQAFDEVCPKRYGGALTLRRREDPSDPQTVSLAIDGPDTIALEIYVTVSHVGGNVYDIATQVEDGEVKRFTYSEPASSGSSLSIAPYLGKKIARHVLNDVEQRLGKQMLRSQMEAAA